MGWKLVVAAAGMIGVAVSAASWGQSGETGTQTAASESASAEAITGLVGRLDLERYKSTIKGLTEFGDRRQGTDRNRKAVDWIEAQLKSYGCTNTERLKYDYEPGPPRERRPRPPAGETPVAVGGGRPRGNRVATGVNTDPEKQPDAEVRALDSQASTPGAREEVFCTKIGTTHPEEMYIVAAHMDGIGFGEAANDDGSGTALVMEIARVLSSPDITTECSIRFALWNNEETGLNGAHAVRRPAEGSARGKEKPPGSGNTRSRNGWA